MTFDTAKTNEFLTNFEIHKQEIRNFPGCQRLELYRDRKMTNIFFTYSYWESDQDLENYRTSNLFREVWGKTKVMFAAKPEAWSVDKIVVLGD